MHFAPFPRYSLGKVQNRYIWLPVFGLTPDGGVSWTISVNIYQMVTDGQGTEWLRNIAENFNRLSRAHERYRRQTDTQTDGQRHSERERSLKTGLRLSVNASVYPSASTLTVAVLDRFSPKLAQT